MVVGLSLISSVIGTILPLSQKPPSLPSAPAQPSCPSLRDLHFCTPSFSCSDLLISSDVLPMKDRKGGAPADPNTSWNQTEPFGWSNWFESPPPPPAIAPAGPPAPRARLLCMKRWKVNKSHFWSFLTKSFSASAGLRLVCCCGDAGGDWSCCHTSDALWPANRSPGTTSSHSARLVEVILAGGARLCGCPCWLIHPICWADMLVLANSWGGWDWGCGGPAIQSTCVMINLKSGCLVGSWRARVPSSNRLFVKTAESWTERDFGAGHWRQHFCEWTWGSAQILKGFLFFLLWIHSNPVNLHC